MLIIIARLVLIMIIGLPIVLGIRSFIRITLNKKVFDKVFKILSIVFIINIVLFVILAFVTDEKDESSNNNFINEEYLEEYENQDKNLNEDYKNIETTLVESMIIDTCEKCFSDTMNWEVISKDNMVYVNIYLDYNELTNINVTDWSQVTTMIEKENALSYDVLINNGYKNTSLAFTIASKDTDEFYFLVIDGEVMFDAIKGIDKLD